MVSYFGDWHNLERPGDIGGAEVPKWTYMNRKSRRSGYLEESDEKKIVIA